MFPTGESLSEFTDVLGYRFALLCQLLFRRKPMKLRLLLAGLLTLMTGLTHANDLSEWKPLLSVTELHELLGDDPLCRNSHGYSSLGFQRSRGFL